MFKTLLVTYVLLCSLQIGPLYAPEIQVPTLHASTAQWVQRYGMREDLASLVLFTADKYDIPHPIAIRLVWRESRFNPNARGMAGEVGLVQMLPSTARDLGVTSRGELLYPSVNVDAGFRYLHRLRQRYRGNWNRTLIAYNQGMRVADTLHLTTAYSYAILNGR